MVDGDQEASSVYSRTVRRPSHQCRWLGRMSSCPYRVSATPILDLLRLTPSSSIMWLPVCSQVAGAPVFFLVVWTSLACLLQLVFYMCWRTSAVSICLFRFLSGIQSDFSMAMVLSYVALVATVCGQLLLKSLQRKSC